MLKLRSNARVTLCRNGCAMAARSLKWKAPCCTVLCRTITVYHRVISLLAPCISGQLRAVSGAPCMHFVVKKYSLVCQRICQNKHGVASTCYLLATSVFFVYAPCTSVMTTCLLRTKCVSSVFILIFSQNVT